MDLKKSALVAEILGGIGIIVSILYLGFEISENNKNTRTSNHLALQELTGQVNNLLMENTALAEMILKGQDDPTSLSEVEQMQFYAFADRSFNVWETAFLMNQDGTLPAGTWELWSDGYCEALNLPGYHALWNDGMNRVFRVDFADVVNACFAQ